MTRHEHIRLFDLHCDTLSELYAQKQRLSDNTKLHISLDRAERYAEYAQLFAVWSRHNLPEDENYRLFFEIVENARPELHPSSRFHPILAVEGAKLLNGDSRRLDALYQAGVRFLTLVWRDVCCIGGAHNTSVGLTDFGKEVVKRCFSLGVVPDVSHSSDAMFYETAELAREAGKPFVATHSNSRALCNHARNLTDDMFKTVVKAGGLVGVSMCTPHLSEDGVCNIDTVTAHIEHYMSLGGESTVCLGCDLDGVDSLPEGIAHIGELYKIADRLGELGYSDDRIDGIFYSNANNFMRRNEIL